MSVIPGYQASPLLRSEILQLCNAAYGENLARYFDALTPDLHVLAKLDSRLVGHAMTVARRLQAGKGPLLRTAYIELVATAPEYQGLGIATAMMRRMAAVLADLGYDLAALSPADTTLYRRLGWEDWLGPLFIRNYDRGKLEAPTMIATPEERIMILRLPNTPALDLNQPLSAEWRECGELW